MPVQIQVPISSNLAQRISHLVKRFSSSLNFLNGEAGNIDCFYLLSQLLLPQEKFENYGLSHLKSVYFYDKNEIFRNFFEILGNFRQFF